MYIGLDTLRACRLQCAMHVVLELYVNELSDKRHSVHEYHRRCTIEY